MAAKPSTEHPTVLKNSPKKILRDAISKAGYPATTRDLMLIAENQQQILNEIARLTERKTHERLTIGDEVVYRKKHWLWTRGERHVISEIQLVQGTIEYATNLGAWFERDDFTFLKPFSKESMKELEEIDEDE